VLDKRIQGRAISLSDRGRGRGDAFRVEIKARSWFVPKLRGAGRAIIARLFAISLMAGISIDGRVDRLHGFVGNYHLVLSSDGCAYRVAEGGDTGFGPASHGAPGSGSTCDIAPGKLHPGTWGELHETFAIKSFG